MSSNTNTIHVVRAAEVGTGNLTAAQTHGMTRKAAILKRSDKICAYVMTSLPNTSSPVHTHGELDTIIYATNSGCTVVFQDGKESITLEEGDFVFIPAYCEHQEVNNSDNEVKLIITRSGSEAVTEHKDGWGGKVTERLIG